MTAVTSTRGSIPVRAANQPDASTPVTADPAGSLLPDPSLGTASPSDALSLIYLLEIKDRNAGVKEGTAKVSALQVQRNQAYKDELSAIQRALEAAKHKSFWDDLGGVFGEIAKVAAVVASIAAAVCTAGAATPLAALAIGCAVLSSASFADSELHILQKLGVDPKTAGWIDLSASLVASVTSLGTGLVAGGRAASGTIDAIERTATVANGAATAGEGATAIGSAESQADLDGARADELSARAISQRALRLMQLIIDDLTTDQDQSNRTTHTIASAKDTINTTTTDAAVAIRG